VSQVPLAGRQSKSLENGSWWNDERNRGIVFQIVTLVATLAVIAFVVNNAVTNLARSGIASGFGFLDSTAGFGISFHLIPYSETDTYGYAFIVGILNTILVSFAGIVAATVLGFIVGVLRLSNNWLVAQLAYWYVEVLRSLPLLLQIIFWWSAFLLLPIVRQAIDLGNGFFLSNRGVEAPTPLLQPGWEPVAILFGLGIVAAFLVSRWARRRKELTGQDFPAFWTGVGLIFLPALILFFILGMPIDFQAPVLRGFNFQGGINIPPELFALWFALSVYTSAFIAEAVRAGIQSVSYGQTEAAGALGLSRGRTMRLVIIPQALRVIVPPLTSQYLNLTKNSSLAVAIGYPELVSITAGTTLNQTGQAIETIAMTMAVYLTLSLLISAFMNWYNRRIALVER